MAAQSRDNYKAVAEIGEIPDVVNPERREACRLDLHAFLVKYFPETTGLAPFSDDHIRVIKRLEQSALKGGRFYNLVYRGFAKTTVSVNTAIWALAYGHRRFVLLVAATRSDAADLLDAIKAELETNEALAEDFPEICHAIAALEGKAQRCGSQTQNGELTRIEWKKDKVVFPTILDANGKATACSGATIVCRGITGAIRGRGKRTGGKQLRPDWVIVDDPQTDASAASPGQVTKRLNVMVKTILKLAGHNSTIAVIVNGTIIQPDDFMDRLRDAGQYPGWQGETVKMVRQWADAHETLWLGDYARIRRSFDPSDPADQERAHAQANEFYLANFKAMNAGCVVSWDHCYDHELEHSAIQHAYNFLIDDGEDVFSAECQSEPVKINLGSEQLTLTDIIHKLSGYGQGEVPTNVAKLTAFVDVQDESLWWIVIAWTADFTGYVIDYGIWPKQQRLEGASKKRIRFKLSECYPQQRDPAVRIRAGLKDLCDELLNRDWLDPDGRGHRIATLFVDQQDGEFSEPIREWARHSPWASIVRPYQGVGVGPADDPMPLRAKKDDEVRRGLNWIEKKDKKITGGTITQVDKNFWSTFCANRWRCASPRPKGDSSLRLREPGALYLWGVDPHQHMTFAQHQLAEWGDTLKHEKSGRSVEVWKEKPGKPDNEWWDGVVGCAIGADYAGGISLKDSGLKSTPARKRKRYTAEELRQLQESRP